MAEDKKFVRMTVVYKPEDILRAPLIYCNYAAVRRADEDATIILGVRNDFNISHDGGDTAQVPTELVARVVMTAKHAKKLAWAILSQVDDIELSPPGEENPDE